MRLLVVAVGRIGASFAAAGCAEYLTRLKRYGPAEIVEVKAEPGDRGQAAGRLEREAERILRVTEGTTVWAMDPSGASFTSEGLAAELSRLETSGSKALALVIGGPDGLARKVLIQAVRRWSLSTLTLPHDLARLILLESLYRARTIQRGEPYHRQGAA